MTEIPLPKDPWREEAREHYFAAGGMTSPLGWRGTEWYWREAAKLWRRKVERLEKEVGLVPPEGNS